MSLTPQEREDLIQRYAAGPARLRAAFLRVPEAARTWRPAPGKWSAHQVVVHCADSETTSAARIRWVLAEKNATIQGYDQDVWAEVLEYEAHPADAALAAVDAVRANTVPLLRRMTAAQWARTGTHTEIGPYSAEGWLQIYADHLETHSRQIERNIAAWQERAR